MVESMNMDLLQQLKRVLENDKVFIGSEFLAYYARLVFGKKPDPQTMKTATLLAKEFKTLLESIENKQKISNVNIISFNEYEYEIYKVLNKCFKHSNKIVDGDICLDEFKKKIPTNKILNSEKATEYLNKYMYQEILDVQKVLSIEEKYMERKCLYNTIGQYQTLYNFIMSAHQEAKSFDCFLEDFNNVLQTALMETKTYNTRNENTVVMSEENVEQMLTKEINRERISTRYKMFDYALNGGFENKRVYMFGGVSGGGKSLVLVNLAFMCLKSLQQINEKNTDEIKIKKAVLYVTLENSIDETKMRFLCCGLGLRKNQIDASVLLNQLNEFNGAYEACFKNPNADLIITWQQPKSINSLDLMAMITDIQRRNNVKIDIVFVDYADKMNAINPSKSDQEWRDLGAITDELKTLAVDYNIPVITVTQLTTNSYKKDAFLDGSSVAGSRRKFENTDFLAIFDFVSQDFKILDHESIYFETVTNSSNEDWVEIICSVDKNRDGPARLKFKTFIDYSSYRMVDDVNNINNIFNARIVSTSISKPVETFVEVSNKNDINQFL